MCTTIRKQQSLDLLQRRKIDKLEVEARRMNKKLLIEKEIFKNKKLFQQMEQEIKRQENQIRNVKRQIMNERMERIEEQKKEREEIRKITDQSILEIKRRQQLKKLQAEQIEKKEREQYEKKYQKALKQRLKLMHPINFDNIRQHQLRYIRKKLRLQTENQEQQDFQNEFIRLKSKKPRIHTELGESSIREYEQKKNKFKEYQQLVKKRVKQRQRYGNEVQKSYHNKYAKSQKSWEEREEQKRKKKQIQEREKYLKERIKPKLQKHFNIEKGKLCEIKKWKHSESLSPRQKIENLELLRENFENKYSLGNTDALNKISKVNLAKADLLLQMI